MDTEVTLENLPLITITDSHLGDDCVICCEKFIKSEQVLSLFCHHFFHKDCLSPWLKKNDKCPSCRSRISKLFMKPLESFEFIDVTKSISRTEADEYKTSVETFTSIPYDVLFSHESNKNSALTTNSHTRPFQFIERIRNSNEFIPSNDITSFLSRSLNLNNLLRNSESGGVEEEESSENEPDEVFLIGTESDKSEDEFDMEEQSEDQYQENDDEEENYDDDDEEDEDNDGDDDDD